MEPYFLRFVNELDFSAIEAHDTPILQHFADAVDLFHQGEQGRAAVALKGERGRLRHVREVVTLLRDQWTDEGIRQTFNALLTPGAEARFPVPLQLKLFDEEVIAHRYFRSRYGIFVMPSTFVLLGVKAGLAGLPKLSAPLAELLKGETVLTNGYGTLIEDLRRTQDKLRGFSVAYAEGRRRAERVVAHTFGGFGLELVTDGVEARARARYSFSLGGAAMHDFAQEVIRPGLDLKVCARRGCGRIFFPTDGRHRFHAVACSREAKRQA